MINSVDFAKYIILIAAQMGIQMNVTKLQKLLYICDGVLLSFGINVISENARAWNYGPVYPKVRTWFSKSQGADADTLSPKVKDIMAEYNYDKIVEQVLTSFGSWTASDLSDWSHRPGSPWQEALERNGGKMNCVISKKSMGEYFKGFVSRA